ncbi:MAG: hypothetical protein ACKOZY_10800 [Flavobacteriales bacterium]
MFSLKHIALTGMLCLALFTVNAQQINLSDSLHDVFHSKPTFSAKMDSWNAFVTGRSAKTTGLKAGIRFKKVLTIGLGYNFIRTDLKDSITYNQRLQPGDLKMRYWTPFIEYTFYKKGPWEVSCPLQIGIGKSFVTPQENKLAHFKENMILLYEPAIAVDYKVLNLFAFGAGYGYRIMLLNNKEIDQQFSSPMYVIRFRVIFETITDAIKKKSSKT